MFGFLRRKRVTQKTDEEAFVPHVSHLDVSEKEHPRFGERARPEEDVGETETRCIRVQSVCASPWNQPMCLWDRRWNQDPLDDWWFTDP